MIENKKKESNAIAVSSPNPNLPFLMPTRHKAIHRLQTNKLFEA